jgi:hypothetical protein
MSTIMHTSDPGQQTIANWFRLFSDERFRKFSAGAYADHNFIREDCRLGFDHFVHNSVDEALLQLYSHAAESGNIAIIGAPFTPCHWGTLAVLLHLFRDGNYKLHAKRTVYWLTTERGERSLFARLRMQGRFRRIAEAINLFPSPESYDDKCKGTSLVMLRGIHELSAVPSGQSVIVSDGRGELVFRTGETEVLVRRLCATGSIATLIIPSRSVTYGLAPEAVCWPWSESTLAIARIPKRSEGEALPWEWELGAQFAGRTERRVLTIEGVKPIEDLLVELKGLAYKLFSKPKSFYDARLMIEFQRIIGAFRQMAIPFDDFERGDDERRLSARLSRLQTDADRAMGETAEEIKIGLMYVSDLVRKLQFSSAKWDLLRPCIDECIERGCALTLAFPQTDPYSVERTVKFVKAYACERGSSLEPQIIIDPDELPLFSGEVVLLGVPKLSQASRWRIPFRGRITVLAWQFDQFLANISMHGSNESAESVRRRTWRRYFKTPLDAHTGTEAVIVPLDESTSSSEVVEVNGEIEAFDPTYRGGTARSEAIVSEAIRAKAEYLLTLDDGTTMPAMAGEEHHVLMRAYGNSAVRIKPTTKLREGDEIILVNGETYGQLTKRLQFEADRVSSLISFNELWERWQMLCLEQDDNDTVREAFIRKIRDDYGCGRGRGTVLSWLRLQRMGPEKFEDIACAALAAGDFELAHNAEQLWKGLDKRRTRHRQLGKWLMRALALSAGVDSALRDKVIDPNLGLTFGDLQRGISVRRIKHVERPPEGVGDE